MPIYEYICGKCGDHLEVNQGINDAPLTTHNISSDCGGPLKKIISMNAFHLKGTGWYKTDYAKPSSTAASTASMAKKDGADSKSSTSESSPTPSSPAKTGGSGAD